ncbi:hypothetical protein GWK47_051031 [Chionoecetes opilio]|uniref:Uncharacterized protein n=1 Tax=Chionoecetes opilio TaxID=41210 RepID=A0A8J5CCX9_CHIOP|nr:hypothetical protein GWK47_051031 [Chionoecetes opilio]
MTADDDIIKQTTKLLVVGNTLQRIFSYCSREVKMELFRSHCYSIYCNSLWSRFKVATLNRLKVCHNDILKRLLGLPRWCSSSLAFARNGVNNLDVIRRHSVFSLKEYVGQEWLSRALSLNSKIEELCKGMGLRFVDGWDTFYGKHSMYTRDGVHLSKMGTEAYGDQLEKAVSSMRSSWSSSPLTVVHMRQFSSHWAKVVLLAGLDKTRLGQPGLARLSKTVSAPD